MNARRLGQPCQAGCELEPAVLFPLPVLPP
jgi:hypothetical protein